MAQVKINIPNIGEVVAENAASEDTLLQILAAMRILDQTKKANEAAASADLKKAKDIEKKAVNDSTESLKEMSGAAKAVQAAEKQLAKQQLDSASAIKQGSAQFSGAMSSTLNGMVLSTKSLTKELVTSYDRMAADPIGRAAGLVNTGLDLLKIGVYGTVDATAGAARALSSIFPVVGPVIAGFIDATSAAAKAVADRAVVLAKTGNEIFAEEFKKSANQLRDYTKAGASFAGGMLEMRQIANESGLSITMLSRASLAATEDFRRMGLTQGEGVKALAAGMQSAKNTIGRSGSSLRDEMLALGLSYEDQGVVMAQYMAQQKTSGQLNKMSQEEISRGTKEYAINLKVLSDITGKDAKKAQEEAQMVSMRADIMSRLTSPEEVERFRAAFASMPDFAKKGFLEYVSSGGTAITDTATNIAIAQNAKASELIKSAYSDIKTQGMTAGQVQDATLARAQEAGKAQLELNRSQGAAINMANTLGGAYQSTADMINQITALAFAPTAEEIKKSRVAAESQSVAADGVTQGYKKVYAASNDFALKMESVVTEHLDKYAKLLGNTMTETLAAFQKVIDWVNAGFKTPEPSKVRERIEALPDESQWQAEALGIETFTGMDINPMATGGITNPNRINIAGEKGPEAVVPLPDGKSIPVSIQSTTLPTNITDILQTIDATSAATATSTVNSINEFMQRLQSLPDSITSAMKNMPGQAEMPAKFDALNTALTELKEAARAQLVKHEQMLKAMQEHKDVSERIVQNTYN